MSGVWVFRNNGVVRLEDPKQQAGAAACKGRKALVHTPTGQTVSSHEALQRCLQQLGWERFHGGEPGVVQFHRRRSVDLISLPADFAHVGSVHMYDIAVKNRDCFRVVDAA
ncbi:unnamed protein product [Urochloa decumbens]|uniref:Uncharacterized protein n=1 Tax=Urochloa decumbens TaxID=240449 RepID=A0ABC9ANV4_9POAL